MSKDKKDPRLAMVDFVKPNGTPVQVNSFPASLDAAVANGWLPEAEYKAKQAAAKGAATKAANAAAAKAAKE